MLLCLVQLNSSQLLSLLALALPCCLPGSAPAPGSRGAVWVLGSQGPCLHGVVGWLLKPLCLPSMLSLGQHTPALVGALVRAPCVLSAPSASPWKGLRPRPPGRAG